MHQYADFRASVCNLDRCGEDIGDYMARYAEGISQRR